MTASPPARPEPDRDRGADGSARSVEHLADIAEEVCCANLRRGPSFAVADAYERWYDLSEDEVAAILTGAAVLTNPRLDLANNVR